MTIDFKARRTIGFLFGTGVFLLCLTFGASSSFAQVQSDGVLTAFTGTVTVNGQPAALGMAIPSGAGITTGQNSSAVVSLGKLGRVEATAETTMTLSYTRQSITITLSRGSVNISARPGVNVTVTRGG